MSLRFALLGLLAVEPGSGYALTQRFAQSLEKYAWHANHSQIYPELNKLAGDGLIEVVAEGARGSRTYAISDAGRDALLDWMLSPPRESRVRSEQILRVFMLSTLEPPLAHDLLRGYLAQAARHRDEIREIVAQLESEEDASSPMQFGRFAAEFGVRQYDAFVEWAQWALARIERYQAEAGQGSERGNRPSTTQ
ncbi:PadR family transcriptional regulator [Actinopolymorpha pittospori]